MICFSAGLPQRHTHASFVEAALEHENLKAAVRLQIDRATRGPLLQPDVLMDILEQRNVLDAATFLGISYRRRGRAITGVLLSRRAALTGAPSSVLNERSDVLTFFRSIVEKCVSVWVTSPCHVLSLMPSPFLKSAYARVFSSFRRTLYHTPNEAQLDESSQFRSSLAPDV